MSRMSEIAESAFHLDCPLYVQTDEENFLLETIYGGYDGIGNNETLEQRQENRPEACKESNVR